MPYLTLKSNAQHLWDRTLMQKIQNLRLSVMTYGQTSSLCGKNANAQSGLTNTGMPNVVSSSSPMDVCNQSATPQPIHRDTCWAQQSYMMPDLIRTHVPVDQQTFDFRYMISNAMNQGASSNGTPWALERLIDGLSEDVA
jgi:hypothetical protein